jgi:hypothetical protein
MTLLGKTTVNLHNIERSTAMASQLAKIGIFDNAAGELFTRTSRERLYRIKRMTFLNGHIVRESLLVGLYGVLKMESI